MTVLVLPGVTAVEVWDLAIDGRPLQAWRDAPDPVFAAHLADAARTIRDAPPASWSPDARARAARIARIRLGGGGATEAIASAIRATGLPCDLDADPFLAARAAHRLAGGLGVDLGQSAIKVARGTGVHRTARDLALAPHRDGIALADRPAARGTTLAWIAGAIRAARDHFDAPATARTDVSANRSNASPPQRSRGDALATRSVHSAVVALPCELDAGGHPRSCTYAWSDPDRELVCDLATRTGLAIAICNDAALAAHALRRHDDAPGITLVLTIGFGVGGALVET